MTTELFSNNAFTTLAGTSQPWASAPAAGTSEIWQVTSTSAQNLPQAVTGVSQFRATIWPPIGDTNPEIVLVTNVIDGTHFQVTRGIEGSPVKQHAGGDTLTHILTAASVQSAVAFLSNIINATNILYAGGVKVDGSTDDTAAWNAAIAACPAGGTVIAKPGVSICNGIVGKSNVTLNLLGITLQAPAGNTSTAGGIIVATDLSNFVISDGVIDGNFSNITNQGLGSRQNGILFNSSVTGFTNCAVKRTVVKNVWSSAIQAAGDGVNPAELIVENANLQGSEANGHVLYFIQCTKSRAAYNEVTGAATATSNQSGIVWSGGSGATCVGNFVHNHRRQGISFANHTDFTCTGNRSNLNGTTTAFGWGIVVSVGCLDWSVTNNRCFHNVSGGCTIDVAVTNPETQNRDTRGVVSSNVFSYNTNSGVTGIGLNTNYARYLTIEGNNCYGNDYGIILFGQEFTVSGNNCNANNVYGLNVNVDLVNTPGAQLQGGHYIGTNDLTGNTTGGYHEQAGIRPNILSAHPQGLWSSTTLYSVNDIVTRFGNAFRALIGNTNIDPISNPVTWERWGGAGLPLSLVTSAGGPILAFDDFSRSDRNLNLTQAPSGHTYHDSSPVPAAISSNRYVRSNLSTFGASGACLVLLPHTITPYALAAEFVFTSGSTIGQNAVVGSCAIGFGGTGQNSVQFAVWPDHWQAFRVDAPASIVQIATGTFSTNLATDSTTKYRIIMRHDVTTSSIVVTFPAASGVGYQTQSFTDSNINSYWGLQGGFQHRHPASTDGEVQFTSIASFGPSSVTQPANGMVIQLPGNASDFIYTTNPSVALTGDIDIFAQVAPTGGFGGGGSDVCLVSQWSTANSLNNRSFSLEIQGTTGKLILRTSVDGIASSIAVSSVAVPAGTIAVEAQRVASTGTVTFLTSTDGIIFTPLGTSPATTSGALFAAPVNLQIGLKDVFTIPYSGLVTKINILNGIAGSFWGGVDFTGAWSGIDAAGNVWMQNGGAWRWVVAKSTVNGLITDLNTINARATAQPIPSAVLSLPGDSISYASSPKPITSITGDLEIDFIGIPISFTGAADQCLISQWVTSTTNRSFSLEISLGGFLQLRTSIDGTASSIAVSSMTIPTRTIAYKVQRVSSTGNVTFLTSTDAVTYNTLGTVRPTTAGALFASNSSIQIGARDASISIPYQGTVSLAQVLQGISGSLWSGIDLRNKWTGTDSAGNVWTFNGTTWTWTLDAQYAKIDTISTDIAPLGTQAAGSRGKSADAGHVHPTTGVLVTTNNLSDVTDGDASRANIKVGLLRSAKVAAISNIVTTTNGLTAIDGYTPSDGDRILLTNQTTGSQNGPWVAHTTAWTRPTDYSTGLTLNGRLILMDGGTYAGIVWQMSSTTTVTVDTTATTWAQVRSPINVQTFTSSGTWTKPTGNYTMVTVTIIAGGGGGGSGRRGAAATVRCGGGGGGAGGLTISSFPYSAVPATQTVTVGTAAIGGPAITVDSTDGSAGGSGPTPAWGTIGGTGIAVRATAGAGGMGEQVLLGQLGRLD